MAAPHQDPRVDQIPGGIEPSTVPAAFPAFINADRAVAEVLASIPSPKLRHISINGGGESILKMKRKMVCGTLVRTQRETGDALPGTVRFLETMASAASIIMSCVIRLPNACSVFVI